MNSLRSLSILGLALAFCSAFAQQEAPKPLAPSEKKEQTIDVKPLKLDIPRFKFHMKPIHVNVGKISFKQFGKLVNIDPIHVNIPRIDLDLKETHVNIPAIHVKVPKVDVKPSEPKK